MINLAQLVSLSVALLAELFPTYFVYEKLSFQSFLLQMKRFEDLNIKCWKDKCYHDSWHFLKTRNRNWPLKHKQHLIYCWHLVCVVGVGGGVCKYGLGCVRVSCGLVRVLIRNITKICFITFEGFCFLMTTFVCNFDEAQNRIIGKFLERSWNKMSNENCYKSKDNSLIVACRVQISHQPFLSRLGINKLCTSH